jgi:hypothetical protein
MVVVVLLCCVAKGVGRVREWACFEEARESLVDESFFTGKATRQCRHPGWCQR